MRTPRRALRSRAFASLCGLLCVALLIWFVGPLVAIARYEPLAAPAHRLVAIVGLALFWFFGRIKAIWQANRANRKLIDEMMKESRSEEAQAKASQDEGVAVLRERMQDAISTLKVGRFSGPDGGRHRLNQLPWYVLIGPPGAGKTTALSNSGLRFPLAERFGATALRGVGGTQHCDWWFTDEAVLLDTAGRYTTQDSDPSVDSAAWRGFLALLRKYRGRQPINGVLVTLSMSDLINLKASEREAHAAAVRARIDELHRDLTVRFPIYVLFTKTDLVAGFCDFFDDLDVRAREQVLGLTFPDTTINDVNDALNSFTTLQNDLVNSLNNRVIVRMQQERDPDKRARAFLFPQQLASLTPTLEAFLRSAFQSTRFDVAPMLRGIYYTSGTQAGHPIDRLLGAMANALSLSRPASGNERSYFIKSFLQNVVFPESALAGIDTRKVRRRSWIQRATYATALALCLLGCFAWVTSYHLNSTYINEASAGVVDAERALGEITDDMAHPLQSLNALSELAAIPGGSNDAGSPIPITSRMGLYQGHRVGRAARDAYRRALSAQFFPRLMLSLEETLRRPPATSGDAWDYQYVALKVYLMLSTDRAHFDFATVHAWFSLDWESYVPDHLNEADHRALSDHLEALFDDTISVSSNFSVDEELISSARTRLRAAPAASRIFARLEREQRLDDSPPAFKLTRVAPEAARLFRSTGKPVSQLEIAGFFTAKGFYEAFAARLGTAISEFNNESWVLYDDSAQGQDATSVAALSNAVRELYVRDYVREWQNLLDVLEVVPFTSLPEATATLGIASAQGSPIRHVLDAVAANTAFASSSAQVATDAAEHLAERGLQRAKRKLERLVGGNVRAPTPTLPKVDHPAQPIRDHFADLNAHVLADGGTPALESTLTQFEQLYAFLHALGNERGDRVMLNASQSQATGVVASIETHARQAPEPLGRWMRTTAHATNTLINAGVQSDLSARWRASGLKLCNEAIAGRYPLDRASAHDITLADFGGFFGPAGELAQYFNQHLKPFVDTSFSPWRVRATAGPSPAISKHLIAQFERAAAIRLALFEGGTPSPSMRFSLKPVTMDSEISQFNLQIGDQTLTYRHDPVRETEFIWPSGGIAKFEMLPPAGDGVRTIRKFEGDWALFRLFDHFPLTEGATAERFSVDFSVGGRSAIFEVRASRALNAFRLRDLERFECPKTF